MEAHSIGSKVAGWLQSLLDWAAGQTTQPVPVPIPVASRRPGTTQRRAH
jgi:hypothetical protein